MESNPRLYADQGGFRVFRGMESNPRLYAGYTQIRGDLGDLGLFSEFTLLYFPLHYTLHYTSHHSFFYFYIYIYFFTPFFIFIQYVNCYRHLSTI